MNKRRRFKAKHRRREFKLKQRLLGMFFNVKQLYTARDPNLVWDINEFTTPKAEEI